MDLRSQRKKRILNMNHGWLQLVVAILLAHPVTMKDDNITSAIVTQEETGEIYSSIPSCLPKNDSVLHLSYKNITLNETDKIMLCKYSNITELYLNNNAIVALHNYSFKCFPKLAILDVSNNSITTIEQAAFAGAKKLAILYLQNNKISQLASNTFELLDSLTVLNLRNNNFLYLDITLPFNSIRITLSGNPWNCSCCPFGLQNWLNNPNITIENENGTVCESPNTQKKRPIKRALLENCEKREMTKMTTMSITFISTNDTRVSEYNGSNKSSAKDTGQHPPGKSWTFLMGVLVVIVGTTMLILMAIKFPAWYRYLISYNHSRLEEDEPEMFKETFTPHIYTHPQTSETNEDESVVVFEQFHTFAPEDDGFIEDKYIEA